MLLYQTKVIILPGKHYYIIRQQNISRRCYWIIRCFYYIVRQWLHKQAINTMQGGIIYSQLAYDVDVICSWVRASESSLLSWLVFVECFLEPFVNTLNMFDSRHISQYFLRSFLFPILKVVIILTFFHAAGTRLSDKHFVYTLASVFQMVLFSAFNVSMFIWSLPISVQLFLSRRASSTTHDVISGTSFGTVWVMVPCSLSYSSVGIFLLFYDLILMMDFFTPLVQECDQSVLA